MRKLFALLAAFAIVAAACGGTEETSTADNTPAETTVAETTTTVAETTTTEAETTTEAPAEEEPAAVEPTLTGQELYEASCARCHGVDGNGTRGPDLIDINTNVPDQQVSFDQVVNGGGGMPSFGTRLSEDEIQSIVDYVYATF